MPDITSAVAAALTAEDCRVRVISHAAAARRRQDEHYEADLSSPESLRSLHQMISGAEERQVAGIINLLGLEPGFRSVGFDDSDKPLRAATWTFQIIKEFAEDLQASASNEGWFFNVTALDGHFGLGPSPLPLSPEGRGVGGEGLAAAGTLGVTKTLRREYPRLHVKNIDVEPNMPADLLAGRLIQELGTDDDSLEIGLTRKGRWRLALQKESLPRDLPPLPLDRESVILVTGGACGITAEIARELAAEVKPRLILVGRSPAPATETTRTRGLDRTALRKLLLEERGARGVPVVPAEIESAVNRILKDREIRATLDACTAAGATVEYHALDVRDSKAFGHLLDNLYERFGRLDGAIHGAGIIEDRRIRDKTLDSFAAVFRTKVDSALTLAGKLRPEGLKFLVFFGSVSGRFGNAGQVDYSAANEMLNKLADTLHQRWSGRVVCINWGPWQGGMVSEELRRLYKAAGVELIPIEEGVAALLTEIRRTDGRGAEVVLACGVERLAKG